MDTVRVQNKIIEVSEPIHRYKMTIIRTHTLKYTYIEYKFVANVLIFDWMV